MGETHSIKNNLKQLLEWWGTGLHHGDMRILDIPIFRSCVLPSQVL